MSGATHSRIPIRQQLLRDQRRAKIIALAAVTIFTVLLVTLILVLAGDDAPTPGTDESAVKARQQPSAPQVGPYPSAANVSPNLRPGTRYDGGPEEGSRGRLIAPSRGSLSVPAFPDTRYDSGPEEGTRGPLTGPSSSTNRYDGGPDEGTRGPNP
jgi:hypothetical protein